MSTKTLITADELEQMPDDDSVQIELDEGELIVIPLAGENHGYCEIKIAFHLMSHVMQHRLGRVYGGDTGFRLNDNTVRGPDVSFVRADPVEAIRSMGLQKALPTLPSRSSLPPTTSAN